MNADLFEELVIEVMILNPSMSRQEAVLIAISSLQMEVVYGEDMED